MAHTPYIGRFAPSPTGDLHLGSLAAAVASFLDAKAHHGKWLVRIEDIDPPREITGASQRILDALQFHGLHWDGEVLYQSTRLDAYQQALEQLNKSNLVFACTCSRTDLHEHTIYPGTCRTQTNQPDVPYAWRIDIGDQPICCEDRIQPQHLYLPNNTIGDFIVYRKEKLFAYQLAVVVDDAFQRVTHVVRGHDLLDSTPKQIYLQKILGLPHPAYAHIPIVTNPQQEKLSKQNLAPTLDNHKPIGNLRLALKHLNQPVPEQMMFTTPEDLLEWAYQHWSIDLISR